MSTKNFNFVERTKEIIRQYDKLTVTKDKRYDVTLFINCCVGLLFVCKEKSDKMPTAKQIGNLLWKEITNSISLCGRFDKKAGVLFPERMTVKTVCRHIRNSIAHVNFDFSSTDSSGEITRINLEDKDTYAQGKPITFKATFDINTFRGFILKVCDLTMQNNKPQKSKVLIQR